MFENTEIPLDSDLKWANRIRTVLTGFLYLSFLFQSLTFSLLFHLIHFRTPNAMAEYRRLLQVNVISAFLMECSFILYMPTALPTNYHLLSYGIVGTFGHKANYYWFFVVGTLVTSHFVAIIGCVLYQITVIWPIKNHNVRIILEFLLASDVRFHCIFVALSLVICFSSSYYVANNLNVDFEPAKHLDLSVPQDRLLYTIYLHNSDNAIYIDFAQTGFLLVLFSLALICFIGAIILGIAYYCFWSKRSTAALKKTQQLQRSLHLSILAQGISLVVFYMIPLELLLSAKAMQLSYAFTVVQLAVISLMIYSPINNAMLLLFVRHFRNETRKMVKNVNCGRNTGTIFVQEREIRTLSFTN